MRKISMRMLAALMALEGHDEYDVRMEVRMIPAARTNANKIQRKDRRASSDC